MVYIYIYYVFFKKKTITKISLVFFYLSPKQIDIVLVRKKEL